MSDFPRNSTQGQRPGDVPPQRALTTPGVQKLSHQPLKQVTSLNGLFENAEFRQRIAESVPQHVTPSRMLRTMVSAIQKAPLLAEADIRGVIGAFLTCSQCGLEPNTPLQHMHLIPFKRTKWNPQTRKREPAGVEVQIIFGYQGLLELSYRSPLVVNVQTSVVFQGDDFSYEYGTNAHLMHRPRGGSAAQGLRPTHAYMMAKLKDGFAFEVMPWEDVLAIRNNSQAFRQALAAKEDAESNGRRLPAAWTDAPWVKFEAAMGRKTVFRSGSKWLPRSVELAAASHIDEQQERRRNVDWGRVLEANDGDYVGAAAAAVDVADDEDGGGGDQGHYQHRQEEQQQPRQQDRRQEERRDPPRDERPTQVRGNVFDDPPEQQGDPGPSDDRAPPRQQQRQQDAPPREGKPAAAAKAPKATLPDFQAGVLDQYGEDHTGEVHVTRAGWANGYATVWATCRSEAEIEALEEFNAESLADARQEKKAAKVLDGLNPPTARMERDAKEAQEAAAAAAAAAAEDQDEQDGDGDDGAAPEGDEGAEEEARANDPPPKDTDKIYADGLCKDAATASFDDVNAMLRHTGIREKVQRFKTDRPELAQAIEEAFAARLAKGR